MSAPSSPRIGPSELPLGPATTRPIIPPRTSSLQDKYEKVQKISLALKKSYDALSEQLEECDQEDGAQEKAGLEYERACIGVELAKQTEEELDLERKIVGEGRVAQVISDKTAEAQYRDINRRVLSAGDALWSNSKKEQRMEDPGAVRLMYPGESKMAECLLALYKKSDGLEKVRKRPNSWRQDALDFYLGTIDYHDKPISKDQNRIFVWCHITGAWYHPKLVKAAHIVPFFLDMDRISEILFGSQSESLEKGGNALLLSVTVKSWFDKYMIVVVPLDPTERPIRRWRTDVLTSDIANSKTDLTVEGQWIRGQDLDGKELVFLGEKRPVSRFLYFHFVMALVRMKDVGRRGWQDAWARYYQERPFPTPGPYLRKSMLLALATHFQTADMKVIEGWITDHGFETPLIMQDDQAREVARRVHDAVEEMVARAENPEDPEEDDEDE